MATDSSRHWYEGSMDCLTGDDKIWYHAILESRMIEAVRENYNGSTLIDPAMWALVRAGLYDRSPEHTTFQNQHNMRFAVWSYVFLTF